MSDNVVARGKNYEIFLSDSGEKCIFIGSIEQGKFSMMGFDEWSSLSNLYGLNLDDDDIVDTIQRIQKETDQDLLDLFFSA